MDDYPHFTPYPESSTLELEALGGRLARRWIRFGRLLRRNGVRTTADQIRELLRALPMLNLADRQDVYLAARAVLCSRREDLPRFDVVFRQFWGSTRHVLIPSDAASPRPDLVPRELDETDIGLPPLVSHASPVVGMLERTTLVDTDEGHDEGSVKDKEDEQEGELSRALLYSAHERLRQMDFARLSEQELAQARALMAGWQWQPELRRTRRLTPMLHGRRLDFIRTMRRAMRTHGIPYVLAMRGPQRKPRPLVVLCDISGSMSPYTRMLLHFLHLLQRRAGRTDVFVFGTRLTRITRQLRVRDANKALEAVGRHVADWAGGTRLGDCLRAFNTRWARRVLSRGAVVCIISDGWDRGDPALVAAEMAHLQRMSFRLMWLNPLLGSPGYQPLTRGMAAALPFVDDFLPVHNLASLEALAALLRGPDLSTRPQRRQAAPSPFHRLRSVTVDAPSDITVTSVSRFNIRL